MYLFDFSAKIVDVIAAFAHICFIVLNQMIQHQILYSEIDHT